MNSLKARIKKLQSHLPKDMLLLCETPDGKKIELTCPEFLQDTTGLTFRRVVSGNNLHQLDLLLLAIDKGMGDDY